MRRRLLCPAIFLILAPAAAAGCGGGDEEALLPPPAAEPPAAPPVAQGDAAAGRELFANAGCGGCHTLEAAGSSGSIGPNLDDLKPSFDAAVKQVTNGGGGMPAYEGQLSEQEILNVATFVVESASR